MHTITMCPRCKKDFMYHATDTHLYRPVAIDLSVPQDCSYEIICHECNEMENCLRANVRHAAPCEGVVLCCDKLRRRYEFSRIIFTSKTSIKNRQHRNFHNRE